MSEVYVADLLRCILQDKESDMVRWLCHVRDLDCQRKHPRMSSACDAVIQTLLRFFVARYLTRSVALVEAFRDLLVACADMSIDSYKRWQRICNVCAFLMANARKKDTIHVFPALKSPILELDEKDPAQWQPRITPQSAASLERYVQQLCVDRRGTSAVQVWLDDDPPFTAIARTQLLLLEHFVTRRALKESRRIVTHMILSGGDVIKTTRHGDVFACIWNVLMLAMESVETPASVRRYVACTHSIFFCMFPAKRSARLCRLGLLYYALLVFCDNKTRPPRQDVVTQKVVNMPLSIPRDMQYLSIFPRIR